MKKTFLFILSCIVFTFLGLMLTAFIGCSEQVSNPTNSERDPLDISILEKQVANSASSFGLKIFDAISHTSRDENV